jgi:hypothetical protein
VKKGTFIQEIRAQFAYHRNRELRDAKTSKAVSSLSFRAAKRQETCRVPPQANIRFLAPLQ